MFITPRPMPHDVVLTTERLLLRRFTPEDCELLVELDSDPEVMRYVNRGRPTPRSDVERRVLPRILRWYDRSDRQGFWAAHTRDDGAFIGWFHLRPDRYEPSAQELGMRLCRAVWGRGYATEGATALVRQAFGPWGFDRVVARTLVGNRASERVLRKCGLRFECFFTYPAALLPGWSEAERRAVLYGLRR